MYIIYKHVHMYPRHRWHTAKHGPRDSFCRNLLSNKKREEAYAMCLCAMHVMIRHCVLCACTTLCTVTVSRQ